MVRRFLFVGAVAGAAQAPGLFPAGLLSTLERNAGLFGATAGKRDNALEAA